MTQKEVLKPEWNLAKKELDIIGEFADKSERFKYRTKKKRNQKSAKKWLNSIEVLSGQLNTHLLNREHTWDEYNLEDKLDREQNIQSYIELCEWFDNIKDLIESKKIDHAINELQDAHQVVHYARVREGFSIPKQIEKINEESVLSDKRR